MPKKKKRVFKGKYSLPEFKSLEQESAFWDTHSTAEYGDWQEVSYKEVLADVKRRSQKKIPISIRVEPELVEKLKKLAKKHGVPYQRVARELLWRGLLKVA